MAAFSRRAQWSLTPAVRTLGPAPHRMQAVVVRRRRTSGEWYEAERLQAVFAGDRDVRLAVCRAYHGGRAEAFTRGFFNSPIVERDVVSLYPHAALLQPLPNATTKWRRVTEISEVQSLEGVGAFKFAFPPEAVYPCLPVVRHGVDRLLFPRRGESHCTFAEVRQAISAGAEVEIQGAHGFEPGHREREHDVGRYMREFLERKQAAKKGSLEYTQAKLLLNALIGKFAEQSKGTNILAFERAARQSGFSGVAGVVARSPLLRDVLARKPDVGALWAPEWAALVLGRSRALMADIVAQGALLVSTDSVIVPPERSVECTGLEALRSVGSDLPIQCSGDAVLIARARFYAILKRVENVVEDDDHVVDRDQTWAVIKIARGGSSEPPESFARTVLACLQAGGDVARPVARRRLLTAEEAVRKGRDDINAEVEERVRTAFRWDGKRRLLDRDVNVFKACTETMAYDTLKRLEAAEHLAKGARRPKRRQRRWARSVLVRAFTLLKAGESLRAVARVTGIKKSTLCDLRRKLLKAAQLTTPAFDAGEGRESSAS